MKVANKRPATIESPVRVTENKYEMWYGRPVFLGLIEKKGQNWYTEDGMRFVSSRDALRYLSGRYETGSLTPLKPSPARGKMKKQEMVQIKTQKLEQLPSDRQRKLDNKRNTTAMQVKVEPYNQNHPRFQEFLEFQKFLASRKQQNEDRPQQ